MAQASAPVEQAALQIFSERRLRACDRGELRHRDIAQEVEMARLAEEVGLVGGDAVDQMDELVVETIVLEEQLGIGCQVTQAERTHAPAQAAFDHGALGERQLDADAALDDLGDGSEMLVAETIMGFRLRCHRATQAASAPDRPVRSSPAIRRSRDRTPR